MQLSSIDEKRKYLQWSAEKKWLWLYILSQYFANKVSFSFAIFVPVLTTFCVLGLGMIFFSFLRQKVWVDVPVAIFFRPRD